MKALNDILQIHDLSIEELQGQTADVLNSLPSQIQAQNGLPQNEHSELGPENDPRDHALEEWLETIRDQLAWNTADRDLSAAIEGYKELLAMLEDTQVCTRNSRAKFAGRQDFWRFLWPCRQGSHTSIWCKLSLYIKSGADFRNSTEIILSVSLSTTYLWEFYAEILVLSCRKHDSSRISVCSFCVVQASSLRGGEIDQEGLEILAQGIFELGALTLTGIVNEVQPRNISLGLHFLEKASEAGSLEANLALSHRFFRGHDVPQNCSLAFRWAYLLAYPVQTLWVQMNNRVEAFGMWHITKMSVLACVHFSMWYHYCIYGTATAFFLHSI